MAELIYPILPGGFKQILDKRRKTFYMSIDELKKVMKNSNFIDYKISIHVSSSPIWKGAHFDCIAYKNINGPQKL